MNFDMNVLSVKKKAMVLKALLKGMSMRATADLCDVNLRTIHKLLEDAGKACVAYHDQHVRDIHARYIECDEIWSFCYAKRKNVPKAKAAPAYAGDVWTWTALDRESKLIVSWVMGGRDAEWALIFMDDLRSRLASRVQLTTDGHRAYLEAVEGAFGGDVDYAQLLKIYGEPKGATDQERKYSSGECCGTKKFVIEGEPDTAMISTSFVERHNLTMRMQMRRFTRLTNAFSKKLENHGHHLALYFMYYNFCRIHQTVRVTPAMQAGLSDHVWSMEDLVEMVNATMPAPGPRGPYKKMVKYQEAISK